MKFDRLNRAQDFTGHLLSFRTNEGAERDLAIVADPTDWAGEAELTYDDGDPVRCRIRHALDYGDDKYTRVFSRTCLSSPRWLRVGVGTFALNENQERVYLDDALADGGFDDLRFTGRIEKGVRR